MSVKVQGLKRVKRAYKKYPKEFEKDARKTLIIYGNKLENSARKDHRFNRKSGKLDSSIKAVIEKAGLVLKFWLDPRMLIVRSKKCSYNYGLIQHDGSYNKYKPSKASPKHRSKTAKNGGGIKHDHFMIRAWDKNIKKMVKELKKGMIKTTKRLGM
ncbi:MAG: hypothetical protein KAS04_03665 [Candidatus Aenigmarchaeota archaeon]|nr:hypothetical protein [Candidatus Aenigmarchaeota archaeon]